MGTDSTASTSRLTGAQVAELARAREALAAPVTYDPDGMAKRIGELQWWLEEMITLAERLGR